jgi:tetratricopeptide (TPR) repeat protein/transcriptional regulator with XRE-family HTH domain
VQQYYTHQHLADQRTRGETRMQRHDPSDFVVPGHFWARPEVNEALAARDAGALFQLIRKHAGASQTGLTMRTGIAKSEISAIMAGRRRVTTLERFQAIADGLQVPDQARIRMGLAPSGAPHDTTNEIDTVDSGAGVRTSPSILNDAPRVWNIQPPVKGFTGRLDEMAAMADCFNQQAARSGEVPVTAVHGIPGIGKTQLARGYADAHKEEYRLGWWVSAETRLDIAIGMSQLAVRLGASEEWSPAEALNFVFDQLAAKDSWLLVFDNATSPADVESFLPPESGLKTHVMITSRSPSWRMLATPIPVDVLTVASASALLTEWSHDEDSESAHALAEELGQLPLAIEQAAAYAADTGISLGEYVSLFRRERTRLLEKGTALAYPGSVAATVTITLENLLHSAPTAMRMLEICSLCSADALPLRQFLTELHNIDDPLLRSLDAVERLEVLRSLRQSGLLTLDSEDSVRLHRVTKVVIQDRIQEYHERVEDAVALLFALFPKTPSEPSTWPGCAQLAPHATSVFVHTRREDLVSEPLASLLTRVGRYFLCSGLSFADARDLHEEALRMRERLHHGDHPEVARGLVHLAVDLNELGESSRARELHERALAMRRRLYPQDHPDVAHSLDNLGNVLYVMGNLELAHDYHEQGLKMRQRIYTADHPNVAYSLSNLAADLHQLGNLARARSLNESALAMRERMEPGDHPDVAHSLSNLASDLHALGEPLEAVRLNQQVLDMRRRLYPGDHPNIVASLRSLAENRRSLGDSAIADALEREAEKMQGKLSSRLGKVAASETGCAPRIEEWVSE